jgi:hypothetical protein
LMPQQVVEYRSSGCVRISVYALHGLFIPRPGTVGTLHILLLCCKPSILLFLEKKWDCSPSIILISKLMTLSGLMRRSHRNWVNWVILVPRRGEGWKESLLFRRWLSTILFAKKQVWKTSIPTAHGNGRVCCWNFLGALCRSMPGLLESMILFVQKI